MMTAGTQAIPVVDAQIHIWEPGSETEWPEERRAYAHRGGASPTVSELLHKMDAAGVDQAILIPPSFAGIDNRPAINASRAYPDRFAIMGRIAVDRPGDCPDLATWRAETGALGLRITFNRGEARQWLVDGTAEWLFEQAEAISMPLMVYAPGKPRELAAVAARHPDLRLIVDHAGLPSSGPPMAVHELIAAMVPLARYANVAVKASALPSTVAEAYPFPTAQDAAQRLVAEFGPQRVFWGTDMTRLKCSYAEAAHFLAEPGGLSADELTWVMGRALREWIHWHAETDADKREASV